MAAPALADDHAGLPDLVRAGQPIVALPPSAGTTRLIDDWLLAHGIAKNERISCNNWGAIAGMLVASVGAGILPEGWAKKLGRANLLRIVDDVHPLATLTYSFQWRRGDSRPLIDLMLPLAASLADFSADAQLPWLI